MKNRNILILFILAAILVLTGALFKLMHWPGAAILLVVGLLAQAICGLLLVLKLWKGTGSGGFLDS
jgi:predicted membrane channel-forming protein YqfA (hemolysin III family)